MPPVHCCTISSQINPCLLYFKLSFLLSLVSHSTKACLGLNCENQTTCHKFTVALSPLKSIHTLFVLNAVFLLSLVIHAMSHSRLSRCLRWMECTQQFWLSHELADFEFYEILNTILKAISNYHSISFQLPPFHH